MSQNELSAHPYILELLELESANPDRIAFHDSVKPLLLKMGSDNDYDGQQLLQQHGEHIAKY